MNDISVSLNHVTKRYGGFTAVDDLSFQVRRGEIYGFLGPNGAGKTSTLRMMLDIIAPTAGAVEVLGEKSAIKVRDRIGYLPEERGLYRKMKAADSIAYFAKLNGLSRRAAREKAETLMQQFGLSEFLRSKNEALSKGMAQKVQLLATIAHEPELLILDEPFSGLDPINQQTLEDLIRAQRDAGRTIIFSTHVMQHAERLCDRFLIIAKGRKRFEGTLSEARRAFSGHIHIRTTAPFRTVQALPGVADIQEEQAPAGADETNYKIELDGSMAPQAFLRNAVEAGVPLSRFEETAASLHDIFVTLAGDEGAAENSGTSVMLEAAE